jgi:hypothetical protein
MGKHIHIRDFDSDLHQVLVDRAKRRGLSLSEYLRQELARLASNPSIDEIMDRLANVPRPNIPREVLQKAMQESRAEREAELDERYSFFESSRPIEK